MLPIEQPFKTYTDRDGKPLNGGFVYFGTANLDPISNPITVYWDAAGTIPAAQPLRTQGGYIVWNGTPANVYFSGEYSELVNDSRGNRVFYAPDSDDFSVGTYINKLISSIGSSLIGFIQAGAGAVAQNLQTILRERVSVTNFGASTAASAATNTTAFNNALDYCRLSGASLRIPDGTYQLTAGGVNFAGDNLQIIGEGMPVLQFTGSGRAFVIDNGGAAGEHTDNMRVENLRIIGGASITDGFYSRGIVRSVFRNIEVRNVSSKAFHILHGVSNVYESLEYSAQGQSPQAARGLQLSNNGAGYYTADCTFINLICEDFPGLSCYIEDGSGNSFLGGTFEGAYKGAVISSTSRRNSFKGIWFEANTTLDLEDAGVANSFEDCYFGSASSSPTVVVSTGQGSTFRSGYVRTINLQSTSTDTLLIGCGLDQNSGGTLGITGTGTYKAIGLTKIDNSGYVVGTMHDRLGQQGTWTPVFYSDGGGSQGAVTSAVGRYSRVGDLCFIQGFMTIAKGTLAAGNVAVTGLPFEARNVTNAYQYIQISEWENLALGAGYTTPTLRISPGGTAGDMIQTGASVATALITLAAFPDPMTIAFSGVYQIEQ